MKIPKSPEDELKAVIKDLPITPETRDARRRSRECKLTKHNACKDTNCECLCHTCPDPDPNL